MLSSGRNGLQEQPSIPRKKGRKSHKKIPLREGSKPNKDRSNGQVKDSAEVSPGRTDLALEPDLDIAR